MTPSKNHSRSNSSHLSATRRKAHGNGENSGVMKKSGRKITTRKLRKSKLLSIISYCKMINFFKCIFSSLIKLHLIILRIRGIASLTYLSYMIKLYVLISMKLINIESYIDEL
uniref:Uncharacterized protein n=1 Tax=Ascaris lumbricoides TaxID=6252 RepID=A0A0M3IID8_ASCLU